jgi:hypothetical protein
MRTADMRKSIIGPSDLPGRLPSGTRYVIEGRRSKSGRLRIVSRQVILPSGEHFDVTAPRPERPGSGRRKPGRRSRGG